MSSERFAAASVFDFKLKNKIFFHNVTDICEKFHLFIQNDNGTTS